MKHIYFHPSSQVCCGLIGLMGLLLKTTSVLKNGTRKEGITDTLLHRWTSEMLD